MSSITITPFHSENQAAAQALILAGLVEHWGFLDEGKNPDLEDIAASYSEGTFLVAQVDGDIIGTGAYLPRSETVVEVVRMSVSKKYRRQGIGVQILKELGNHAVKNRYQKIILETTRTWYGVIGFYKQFGFQYTHNEGDDAYFELDL